MTPDRVYDDMVSERATQGAIVEAFAYLHEAVLDRGAFTASDIRAYYDEVSATPPARLKSYLSEGTQRSRKQYLRSDNGYRIHRDVRRRLDERGWRDAVAQETERTLRSYLDRVTSADEQEFLDEAIRCVEVKADRAAVVMIWTLAVYHMRSHTFDHHLPALNSVLSTNSDRSVRVRRVDTLDHFNDIPEGKLIDFLRQARIISADVERIMRALLGTRNSFAHPGGVSIGKTKVLAYVEDVIINILLKY